MIVRAILMLLFCATLFAQRTPLKVNGTVVSNPNFTNSASLIWSQSNGNVVGVIGLSGGFTNKVLVDNGVFTPPFEVGSFYTNFVVTNMTANADNDAYTVPNGLRALLLYSVSTTNTSQSLLQVNIKSGGVYYAVSGSVGIINTNNSSAQGLSFVFEPGDVISFKTDVTGASVLAAVQLFSTNSSLKTPRIIGLTSGDNILYTAPADKMATRWGPIGEAGLVGILTPILRHTAGSNLFYTVTVGGRLIVTKGVQSASAISTGGTALAQLSCVPPGQAVVINSTNSSLTQMAWMPLYEVPQ